MIQAHLLISGQVQGVFFRATTQEQAERLGVTGWAKNLSNGQVEVVIEGSEAEVKKMVDWCHHGPSAANVTNVDIHYTAEISGFSTFETRYG